MIVSVSFWPWRFWCWLCIWREGCYVRESLFFFLTERKRCWHFLSKFQYSEVHSICRKKATMSFCRRKQKILIILSWLSRITCITCLNCITCFTRFTGNPKNINHWLTDNLKSRDASASKKRMFEKSLRILIHLARERFLALDAIWIWWFCKSISAFCKSIWCSMAFSERRGN